MTVWFQNRRQRKIVLNYRHTSNTEPSLETPRTILEYHQDPHCQPLRSTNAFHIARPLLDHVANCSQLPTSAPTNGTPRRRQDPQVSPWDNMDSSPIGSPDVGLDRVREANYLALGQQRRSLEWACAAARIDSRDRADHDGHEITASSLDDGRGNDKSVGWTTSTTDDDLMAAYTLCEMAISGQA